MCFCICWAMGAQNPYNWESIDSDPPDEIQRLDEDKTDTGVFTTTS